MNKIKAGWDSCPTGFIVDSALHDEWFCSCCASFLCRNIFTLSGMKLNGLAAKAHSARN